MYTTILAIKISPPQLNFPYLSTLPYVLKAYEQGYSQHMIAKVLGITQQAVFGIIKRGRK